MPSVASQDLANRLVSIGERAVSNTGIDLVDVELRGAGKARLLRVYIDKPGGITHADCELVSERFGNLLDEEDAIPEDESYTLEVSSPGVERKLTKQRDFERVIGQSIRIAWREPAQSDARPAIRKLEGKLAGLEDRTLLVQTASGETVHVPLDQVQKANLKFEW